jgi:N-acetylmuramoyl-L-alanine amidase
MMQQFLSSVLLVIVCICSHATAVINDLKVQNDANHSIITLKIHENNPHKIFVLHNPERLVIDFTNTRSTINLPATRYSSGIISAIRSGYPSTNVLRLVFDLNNAVTFNYSKNMQNFLTYNLVINVRPKQQTHYINNTIKPPLYVKHASYDGRRDIIVVLDPGHGGKDPGAIGPRKTREKNVVLSIARQLQKLINQQPGMHAVLTRDGDYYVGLRKRLAIARKYNADVFIAIHADAVTNHESYGASVYALSQRGATSEAARWLAAKENYSELGGVQLSRLHDQTGVIRTVLIDLSQTATIGSSLQIGTHVLDQFNTFTRLHHRRVEQARFVVLKSPDIPSILIETGFISNPDEEKNLLNPTYQQRLTRAILAGIKTYFWSHPPHGTRIEAMLNRR